MGEGNPAISTGGPRIGPYLPVRELGSGGMGAVFLAERADGRFRRQVAVKLLHHGLRPELERRFHQEGRLLAGLEHSNIARLYDSDVAADGRPFLVMEYVEGLPILEFCDRHRLSIEDRLRLFRKVCAAVQYAHQHLVVHRDLKPDNILVTDDGEPKLLDFGIAKLLDPGGGDRGALTRTGFSPMTPRYASPEQVLGEAITTASDTYSLGVLLYELLVGRRPYRLQSSSPMELERAIAKQDPEPPSVALGRLAAEPDGAALLAARSGRLGELRRSLHDLDHVVAKALRKDPAQRYRTVEQLSEDLHRYLKGLPVTARPLSLAYRGGKFLRRHRFGLGVLAAVAVLVAAFAVAFVRQAREVERERDRAERALDFLVDVFAAPDPQREGSESITARQILEAGADKVLHDFPQEPRIQVMLLDAIGRVYVGLGLYDEAEPMLERALAMRRELFGEEHLEVAASLQHLAELRHEQGDYAAAEDLFRKALAVRREAPGDNDLAIADALNGLSSVLRFSGQLQGAEEIHREALEIRRRILGPSHPDIARSLDSLASYYFRLGDYERAADLYGQASEMFRRELGPDHPDSAMCQKHLGLALGSQGDLDRAEEMIGEALDVLRRTLGEEHQFTVQALNNLAWARLMKGDYEGAEEPVRRSLELLRRRLAEDHPTVLLSRYYLGLIYLEVGKLEAAAGIVPTTVELARERLGTAHPTFGHMVFTLGYLRWKQGRLEEAEAAYLESLGILESAFADGHEFMADPLLGLGRVEMVRGNPAAAEPRFRRALELLRRTWKDGGWMVAEAALEHGACLAALGRTDEAEPMLRQSLADLTAHYGAADARASRAAEALAEIDRSRGLPATPAYAADRQLGH